LGAERLAVSRRRAADVREQQSTMDERQLLIFCEFRIVATEYQKRRIYIYERK
jgi:hypothetical protein